MFHVFSLQVFIRELISNSSDALEKLRYVQMTDGAVQTQDEPLEIHIAVDDDKKTFTIQASQINLLPALDDTGGWTDSLWLCMPVEVGSLLGGIWVTVYVWKYGNHCLYITSY